MIVGPAVSEAELQHRPGDRLNQGDGEIQAGALGLQPADKRIQSAQLALIAARSLQVVFSSRRASSRMISTAISGNSVIILKN